MTIKDFLLIILKRLQVIILFTVLGAVSAGIISFIFIKPVYQSTSSFYVLANQVSKDNLAYNELLASQMLVSDCREYIRSRDVLEQVKHEMSDLNIEISDLASKISIQSKNDTRVLEIKVNDTDPQYAYFINQSLSSKFLSGAKEVMKIDNISMVDSPNVPEKPISPNKTLNILLGAFLGCALSVFIIFAIEYFDTTIKTQEDVEKYLGMPVIGKIPVID